MSERGGDSPRTWQPVENSRERNVMADDDRYERFDELTDLVLGGFEFLRQMLTGLPIPVAVPELDADNMVEVLLSLDRARDLVKDEPLPEIMRLALDKLILDWFTAYELSALGKMAGLTPWRLDGLDYAVMRFAANLQLIEDGGMDDEQS
jgi:hypothetical protein